VDSFAKSLIKLGFERFDIVNIIGFNAPEWLFANVGAIAAGGVAAGIYATNNAEACKYVANHSKAKVIVCDGVHQLEKFYEISKELPALQALVMYGTEKVPADAKDKCSIPIYSFVEFLELGTGVSMEDLQSRSQMWKSGETCTLIYTSGTTGGPKAALLTNGEVLLLEIGHKQHIDNNRTAHLPCSN
jgi:long-chain-fatty-acid--CoA ligase ACSBG